jgi:hypothetical protein
MNKNNKKISAYCLFSFGIICIIVFVVSILPNNLQKEIIAGTMAFGEYSLNLLPLLIGISCIYAGYMILKVKKW